MNTLSKTIATCLSFTIFLSALAAAPAKDSDFTNAVKTLRGERSILKSKAIQKGAGLATVVGLAAGSSTIADPGLEVQILREPSYGIPEGEEWSEDYRAIHMRNIGEKTGVIAAGSALVGSALGGIYSAVQKQRTLAKINTLLRAYTNLPAFQNLSFDQSALLYAAYLQDFEQLKELARTQTDFLNRKGVFNIIATLFFNKHATHDMLTDLKDRLGIDSIEINYLPDVLAKSSLGQRIKEAQDSGIARFKAGTKAVGSRLSSATKAATAPFRLNYISEKDITPFMRDSSQFQSFLEAFNPNILVGSFGGYLTGSATPVLGYALVHGKSDFANFLIEHGAQLTDKNIQKRSLYKNKQYGSYLDLAIDKQLLSIVKKLVSTGATLGKKELHRTFSSPSPEIVSYIANLIQDTNTLEPGINPLDVAILARNKDLIARFLTPETVNKPNENGDTPLHSAASQSSIDTVTLLLENGASPAAKNKQGNTPLHVAKNAQIAAKLIEYGASANSKNNNGDVPLFIALSHLNTPLIEVLMDATDLSVTDNNQNSLLHQAIKYKKNAFAKELIQRAPSLINHANRNKETPLAVAMEIANNEIAETLLASGANIESRDRRENTPLVSAIINNNLKGAKLLLSYNANPTQANNAGQNALHLALIYKQYPLIDDLLKNGASINAQTLNDDFPLHIALDYHAPLSIIKRLISPSNVNAANSRQNTPLSLAVIKKNKPAIITLLQAGANPNIALNGNQTVTHIAARNLDWEVLTLLLQNKAQIHYINSQGNLPLHEALLGMQSRTPIQSEAARIVQSLANQYLINTANNRGRTPLSLAASIPNRQLSEYVIGLLHRYGARNDIADEQGKYPYEYSSNPEVRRLLGYIAPQTQ